MNDDPREKTLAEAMIAAWAEIEPVKRVAAGQEGNQLYQYAPIEAIDRQLKPILARHGLGVYQWPIIEPVDGDASRILVGAGTRIMFGDEVLDRELTFPVDANSVRTKSIGGLITYAKRYSYPFALAEDDVDANDEPRRTPARRSPPQRQQEAPAKPDGPIPETARRRLWVLSQERVTRLCGADFPSYDAKKIAELVLRQGYASVGKTKTAEITNADLPTVIEAIKKADGPFYEREGEE